MITIIAAITASKGALGRKGELLYHISEDLKRFKALTTGNTVIMGRKTYESLPGGALPNRRNIVLTSSTQWSAPGVEVAHTATEALQLAGSDGDVFIIGGGSVYAEMLPVADKMEITLISGPEPTDADTFFPPIDPMQWEIAQMGADSTDSRSGVTYRFVTFHRTGRR